jgi:hypothetical protein
LKWTFSNFDEHEQYPPEATKQIPIKDEKAHSKKTTFTCEKNRFSLGKHSVLN